MKQTAVEFLVEQFDQSFSYINELFKYTIEQAKEMEKQQIIEAVENGGIMIGGEEYYDETFKKKQ